MQSGAVLISEIFPTFELRSKTRMGHNLTNISTVLRGVAVSPGYDLPDWMDGFDLFCAYLLFDAWIANRDRHEENWSIMAAPDGLIALAPSYDHDNSLGFNLLDKKRRAGFGQAWDPCGLGQQMLKTEWRQWVEREGSN